MNVKQLRKLLTGLPDEATVMVDARVKVPADEGGNTYPWYTNLTVRSLQVILVEDDGCMLSLEAYAPGAKLPTHVQLISKQEPNILDMSDPVETDEHDVSTLSEL